MPKTIRGILDDLWYRGWVANTHDREKEVTSAEAQIKAIMDEELKQERYDCRMEIEKLEERL